MWRWVAVLTIGVGVSAAVIVLVLTASGTWARLSTEAVEELPPMKAAPPQAAAKPRSPPAASPRVEILMEKTGRDAMMGYYVWCLVEPMTEPQLRTFADQLIAKMRAVRGDHLKAWLFYNREDFDPRPEYRSPCVIWLNATGPDYEVFISGPIPKERTPKACYEAYIEDKNVLSERPTKNALVWCEFDEANMAITYHDRLASAFVDTLSIEDIVLQVCSNYLPGSIRPSAWAAIPGLKSVTLHLYEKDSDGPVITLQYGREAYERSLPVDHALWELRSEIEEQQVAAEKRHRALLMTDEEYRAAKNFVAQQMYGLYEGVWIEVSTLAKVESHKTIPHTGPDRLRKYFFGN